MDSNLVDVCFPFPSVYTDECNPSSRTKLLYFNLIHLYISIYSPLQMDPKLRPSFPDIVRNLEEILARLKVEEMEHECVSLSGDIDKKTIPKGNSTSASDHFSFSSPVTRVTSLVYKRLPVKSFNRQ